MNNLAIALKREGHLAEAQALQQQTLDINRRVLGPEHPRTLVFMNNLAETWAQMGKYAEAEKLVEQARDIQLRVLPPDDPTTAVSTYNLAGIAAREGHRDFAFSMAREAIDHGLPPLAAMSIAQDPDLTGLHGDPRFDALVALAKQRAASNH
jgi:non-specific serine/threonine protein kinase/serine/threonine-protein kinase